MLGHPIQISMEMRKWKCDKFQLPDGINFSDVMDLYLSVSVSSEELLTLQEAFATKLVTDAAVMRNEYSSPQPHLGFRDMTRLKNSIGKYLSKTTTQDGHHTPGMSLMVPFSQSGFLETPIEDFNSVANFNESVQAQLAAIFKELVQLNGQVESDKEFFLNKVVATAQRLDSLKNELAVVEEREV